ncbi:carbohydrate sulfotransferase 11-like isoform X2 [Penaeus japonicus]|uniref:carbohydrate sulfotransferase 11-like isoform X2 n=1 Tax=Penaeus japonicus TaxID=27405 RepID=UPI001C714F12|nr:carbohydrate sulfotransferase 11-like isoform X2 [Penaeus japonicus]
MWPRTRKLAYLLLFLFVTMTALSWLAIHSEEMASALAVEEKTPDGETTDGDAEGDARSRGTDTGERKDGEYIDAEGGYTDRKGGEYHAEDESKHNDTEDKQNKTENKQNNTEDKHNTTKQTAETRAGHERGAERKEIGKNGDNRERKQDEGDGMVELFRERRERVRGLCEEARKGHSGGKENLEITLRRQILHGWDWNVSVCVIPKVGSGTWRGHVNRMNGRSGDPLRDPKRRRLVKRSSEGVLASVRKTVRIMTVRNPLTRLVSAYRNKFRDGKRFGVHHKKGKRTFLRHALKHLPADRNKNRLSFPDFLTHVVKSHKEGRVDMHWQTFSYLCSPCQLDYNYVTKLEQQTDELRHVFQVVGLPADPARKANPIKMGVNKDASDLAYYKKVPLKLRKQIYDIFKFDMVMFDYQLPRDFWDDT